MSYAIESSKRKFHRLLESISSNESRVSSGLKRGANDSTVSLALDGVGKRRRLGDLTAPPTAISNRNSVLSEYSVDAQSTAANDLSNKGQGVAHAAGKTSPGRNVAAASPEQSLSTGSRPEAVPTTSSTQANQAVPKDGAQPFPFSTARPSTKETAITKAARPISYPAAVPTSQSPSLRLLSRASAHINRSRQSVVSVQDPEPSECPSIAELDSMKIVYGYRPTDREQLLKRIQSFHISGRSNWTIKPQRINEVEFARRGWHLVGKERVGCVYCRAEWLVPWEVSDKDRELFPDEEGSSIFDSNREAKCEENLVTAHQEGCPWMSIGCNDRLYSTPMSNEQASIDRLGERFRNIYKIETLLPSNLPDLEQAEINWYTKAAELFSPLDPDHPNTRSDHGVVTTLRLAIHGWDFVPTFPDTLRCGQCFRRVGLWLFRSPTGQDEPSAEAASSILDPAAQHYDHCTWVNGNTQCPGSKKNKLAGHQILKTLVNKNCRTKGINGFDEPLYGELVQTSSTETASDQAKAGSGTEGRDEADKRRFSRLQAFKKVFSVKKKDKRVEKPGKG